MVSRQVEQLKLSVCVFCRLEPASNRVDQTSRPLMHTIYNCYHPLYDYTDMLAWTWRHHHTHIFSLYLYFHPSLWSESVILQQTLSSTWGQLSTLQIYWWNPFPYPSSFSKFVYLTIMMSRWGYYVVSVTHGFCGFPFCIPLLVLVKTALIHIHIGLNEKKLPEIIKQSVNWWKKTDNISVNVSKSWFLVYLKQALQHVSQ